MATHRVVKHDEWLKARKRHLAKEKEFTRMRDQLSRERRDLPWELVEKQYSFQGEHGTRTLGDLFEGRGQLVIYHAMFNPDTAGSHTPWTTDAPCFVCSFWMDNFNGITTHLNHRDITMAAVSLAPYPKLAAYKTRMGWGFPWWSSLGSDFNFDYGVSFKESDKAEKVDYNYRLRPWGLSEAPGISVFMKDGGQILARRRWCYRTTEPGRRSRWPSPAHTEGLMLEERLAAIRAMAKARLPEDAQTLMQRDVDDLRASGILDRVVKVGTPAPDFTLPNTAGLPVSLDALLARGPVVLSFFRGRW